MSSFSYIQSRISGLIHEIKNQGIDLVDTKSTDLHRISTSKKASSQDIQKQMQTVQNELLKLAEMLRE